MNAGPEQSSDSYHSASQGEKAQAPSIENSFGRNIRASRPPIPLTIQNPNGSVESGLCASEITVPTATPFASLTTRLVVAADPGCPWSPLAPGSPLSPLAPTPPLSPFRPPPSTPKSAAVAGTSLPRHSERTISVPFPLLQSAASEGLAAISTTPAAASSATTPGPRVGCIFIPPHA